MRKEDPYSDMTSEEKSKLLIEFKSMHEADRKQITDLMERLDKFIQYQASSADFKTLFESEQKRNAKLLKRIDSLEALLKVRNANLFGSKSQKGKSKKNDHTDKGHQKDKDDFDGTPGSIDQDTSSEASGKPAEEKSTVKTDRMQEISVLEYLRSFFREIVKGRRDYKNLLPMTIGINNNKL